MEKSPVAGGAAAGKARSRPTSGRDILVAGSGRSGTTWLAGMLGAHPNIRMVFEPFDPRRVPEAAVLPLHTYARRGEVSAAREAYVRRVFAGQVETEWTRRLGRRWWAHRRLVKAIRANLLLDWIDDRFDIATAYCIRHPCAVVLSRVRLGWEHHLDLLVGQPDLVEDYLEPYIDVIDSARTELASHAAAWCIENLVPLRKIANRDWVFSTYEGLCLDPRGEIERMRELLSIGSSWMARGSNVARMPREDSAIVQRRDLIEEWRRHLSVAEVDTILRFVRAFEIDIYDDGLLPHLPVGSVRSSAQT